MPGTTDDEQVVTDSGGTMTRLDGPVAAGVEPDLALLADLRPATLDGPVRAAGEAPYFKDGAVVTWHYSLGVDVLRVVRDDERGLVAWLPAGSERLAAVPRDGKGLRERSLEERAVLGASGYDHLRRTWDGSGILRVAPTGVPWSLWYFWEDDGSFAGHYVNLELVHDRPASGEPRVHTRDLVLDLWLDADGQLWLKDEDELAAFTAAGRFHPTQADVIRALADRVRTEVVAPRAWPLDEDWESWRPPPEIDRPLTLPDHLEP